MTHQRSFRYYVEKLDLLDDLQASLDHLDVDYRDLKQRVSEVLDEWKRAYELEIVKSRDFPAF